MFYKKVFKNVKVLRFKLSNKTNVCFKKVSDVKLLLYTLIDIIVFIYLFYTKQLVSFVGTWSSSSGDTIHTFIMVIIRFLPVSNLIFVKLKINQNQSNISLNAIRLFYIVSFFIIGIIYFPINGILPRYFLFAVYLMIFQLYFNETRYKSVPFLVIIAGFVFVFPAFNYFKYHGIGDLGGFSLGGLNFNFYDYDAFQMLMNSVKYVEKEGIFYGLNIISALFCFIPRSIWHGKLEPSGSIVSKSHGAVFNNLSCPIFAEFYLAFGILGNLILTIVLAYLLQYCNKKIRKTSIMISGVMIIVSGMTIYIMRGSLLPAISYTLGMIISFILSNIINDKI